MRILKWIGRTVLGVLGLGCLMYFVGPYEEVDTDVSFDPAKFGEGVQVYFESVESAYGDITPGVEKKVVWAGRTETKTPLALLYVHGFSASGAEIRPVPEKVASELGANLVYTRLTGHGRPGVAMGEASVRDWMEDVAEGLAAARAVGEEVIVIATSTGGTLAALTALDPALSEKVKGMIFISPNFGINDPMAGLLTIPAARYILPMIAGETRKWEAQNIRQEKYWATEYPTVAVFPMAALVQHTVAQDYSGVSIPALFHYSEKDTVVVPAMVKDMAARWGGAVTLEPLPADAVVERSNHVLAGDIVSPERTGPAAQMFVEWIRGL